MADREFQTFNVIELNKGRGTTGTVHLEAVDVSGGSATLKLTTTQAVTTVGTFTASHKLIININGTEYYIQLDAV